jgi:hypothetical protein
MTMYHWTVAGIPQFEKPWTRLYSIDVRVTNDDEQMRTNIHALSGIWTHGLSIQVIKAYASDRAATGTSTRECWRSESTNAAESNALSKVARYRLTDVKQVPLENLYEDLRFHPYNIHVSPQIERTG